MGLKTVKKFDMKDDKDEKKEKPEWAEGTKKKETDTKSEATEGDVAIEEEEE